jgi:hypothetical protein
MATLWSCPNPDCPPSEIVPVDVPESGEAAGAEAEGTFTTDEVAALLNVPLTPSTSGTRKAQGLRVIRCTWEAITEGVMSFGGWPSKG